MTVKQRALPVRSYSINQRRNRFMFVREETYIARCEGVTQRARRFRYCSPSLSRLSINHRSADKHHIWLLSPLLDSHFSINYNHSTSSVDVSSHNIRPLSVRGGDDVPAMFATRDNIIYDLACSLINQSILVFISQ